MLIKGDCVEELDKLISQGMKVDLTVTSPPYDNLRTYEGTCEWNFDIFTSVANRLFLITKEGGVVVWVVGDATIKGSETGSSFKQALYFKEIGFNLHDTMIYEKSQACFGSNLCYLQSFEYMFVFSKGKPKSINLIRDRKNVVSGEQSVTKNSAYGKEGNKSPRHTIVSSEFGKRKNIWKYSVGSNRSGHPAVFPYDLAKDHILSWSNAGDTVLDPFMGSGTTGIACRELGRSFIGIEKVDKYFDISSNRIKGEPIRHNLTDLDI